MSQEKNQDDTLGLSPKVSIIVTAYNIENYIAGCLDDITKQSLEDIEIIVVDDGSSDTTPEIIREFASKDRRIKPIFFAENTIGGVASAANAGILAAQGEYVGFADGDDVYYSQMFENLYLAAKNHDSDLSMCNYKLRDAKTDKISDPADTHRWKEFSDGEFVRLDEISKPKILNFISVPWRKLYRRELLTEHEILFPVTDHFYEDNPFHWFTTLKSKSIVLINESLCEHRVSRTGQTMISADRSLFGIFAQHKIIRQWLEEENVLGRYKVQLFRWLSAQVSWTSLKLDQQFLEEYFTVATQEIKHYPPKFIRSSLRRRENIDHFARLRMFFLSTENQDGFLKHRDPARHFSLLYQAYLHIQLYGVIDLLKTGPKFLIHEAKRKKNGSRRQDQNDSDHLIASLLIVDERLKGLEKKISQLSKD